MKKNPLLVMGATEASAINAGYPQLTGEELRQGIEGKTIWGDYLYGYKFIVYIGQDGTMEGTNQVGSYNLGSFSINDQNKTITVTWSGGWIQTTSRAYDVDGVIVFFNCDTGQWDSCFKKFEEGRTAEISPSNCW